MCTGRVDLAFPLRAFLDGADGVLVGGCRLNECHYITGGNFDALGNAHLLWKLMRRAGLDTRRLRLEWMSSAEGSRFAAIVTAFAEELEALRQPGTGEGLAPAALSATLESYLRLVPQLKLLMREKLAVRVKSEQAYADLYANQAVDRLLDDLLADPVAARGGLPGYAIDAARCVGCLLCAKRCPSDAIAGAHKVAHVIDPARCTHCAACYYVCPPKVAAVRRVEAYMQPSGEGSPASLHAPDAGPDGKSA